MYKSLAKLQLYKWQFSKLFILLDTVASLIPIRVGFWMKREKKAWLHHQRGVNSRTCDDAALAATWLSPGGSHTPHSPPPSPELPWSGWLCRRRSSCQPKAHRHSGEACCWISAATVRGNCAESVTVSRFKGAALLQRRRPSFWWRHMLPGHVTSTPAADPEKCVVTLVVLLWQNTLISH